MDTHKTSRAETKWYVHQNVTCSPQHIVERTPNNIEIIRPSPKCHQQHSGREGCGLLDTVGRDNDVATHTWNNFNRTPSENLRRPTTRGLWAAVVRPVNRHDGSKSVESESQCCPSKVDMMMNWWTHTLWPHTLLQQLLTVPNYNSNMELHEY